MKRRDMPRELKPYEEWQPGETWGQRIRRLYPKEYADAQRRMDREALLWLWPRVAEVKTEYRRRRNHR